MGKSRNSQIIKAVSGAIRENCLKFAVRPAPGDALAAAGLTSSPAAAAFRSFRDGVVGMMLSLSQTAWHRGRAAVAAATAAQ